MVYLQAFITLPLIREHINYNANNNTNNEMSGNANFLSTINAPIQIC